jgi:hypothetical protein
MEMPATGRDWIEIRSDCPPQALILPFKFQWNSARLEQLAVEDYIEHTQVTRTAAPKCSYWPMAASPAAYPQLAKTDVACAPTHPLVNPPKPASGRENAGFG